MERHDKRLTEHFCLDEFTYSGIAVDNAINNQPPPCACLALQNWQLVYWNHYVYCMGHRLLY